MIASGRTLTRLTPRVNEILHLKSGAERLVSMPRPTPPLICRATR
jgi:hypothetical protein